jgi:hypothetical protein
MRQTSPSSAPMSASAPVVVIADAGVAAWAADDDSFLVTWPGGSRTVHRYPIAYRCAHEIAERLRKEAAQRLPARRAPLASEPQGKPRTRGSSPRQSMVVEPPGKPILRHRPRRRWRRSGERLLRRGGGPTTSGTTRRG